MANYRKSFNLRNGVQIDDDNFIVNANGLVGIGTSIPTAILDVRGDAKVVGLVTANNLYAGIATVGVLTVTQGLSVSGVVAATSFVGSAAGLTGIYAVAVDGWNVNSGTISTTSNVGIGTTIPNGTLQIGTGVTINANGNATYSGTITAASLSGSLNASNLTGTIDNARLPANINSSGIITATTFVGNLTGTATTASSISSNSNLIVNSVSSAFSTSGISTVHTTLHVPGNIGVGTLTPNTQIHVRKFGISSVQLTSDGSNSSIITFGRNVNIGTGSSNAQFRFGNTNGTYPSSTEQSLDIINYDIGNLNFYLNPGGAGTGSYNWFSPTLSRIMTLTSSGNLGINSNSPSDALSVIGNAKISGVTTVGSLTASSATVNGTIGVATNSSSYALQVGNDPSSSNGVGISSNGNIIASGIVTATQFVGDGSGLTGIVASGTGVVIQDEGGNIGTAATINFVGAAVTATISGGVASIQIANHYSNIAGIATYATTAGVATNAQGLTGTPNVVVGIITATSFRGDGSQLTGISTATGKFIDNAAGIHTTSAVGIKTDLPKSDLQVARYGVSSGIGTFIAVVSTEQIVDQFNVSTFDFRTAEYTLHIQHANGIQAQKVLVMQDGTTAYSNEFAIMYTTSNPLVSVSSTISAGVCQLRVTPQTGVTGITTYRFSRETLL